MPPSRNLMVIGGGAGGSEFSSCTGAAIERVLVRRFARPGVLGAGERTGEAIGDTLNRLYIFLTVRGEMALRSMKIASVYPSPFLSFLAFAAEEHTSAMRFAIASASRGGTILRMMSAFASKSSSEPASTIFAVFIRSTVCWLWLSAGHASHTVELAFCLLRL